MSSQSLLYKGTELKEGYNPVVGPENADLRWLEFGRILVTERKEYASESGAREECFSIFSGKCSVMIEGDSFQSVDYHDIGWRDSIFSGKPTMVYIPRGARYKVVAKSKIVDLGIFKAPSRKDTKPILIKPEDRSVSNPGAANWRREVCTTLGEWVDVDRLIVGETYSVPGNWSSYPPHKHDSLNPPREAPYEEIYFFLIQPPQGFGIQRVYTPEDAEDPLDEVYVIENGDTVVIPRGYHPVSAAPGYQVCYFWALAGEERRCGAWSDDPRHAWIRNCEPILTER